ncbi:MAG: hypothetical protein IAE78_17765 [Myxococcus sp.]|nr:hypothetical protein [Myxococcus sp.]
MLAGSVDENLVEVESGVVKTFDGEAIEVRGGAYLSPEGVLRTTAELQRLRSRVIEQDELPSLLPIVACTTALAGLALGYWLGRRRSSDD